MYLHMVIGEMINEDQLREFRNVFKEESIPIQGRKHPHP